MRKTIIGLLGFSSIAGLAISCADWADLCAGNVCSPLTDNGDGGDGGFVDEAKSLFVSTNGNDNTGDGSTGKPYKTIGKALASISPSKLTVYVCDGTYQEDIVLGSAQKGVSIYGKMSCSNGDWQPSDNLPNIGKSTVALKINSASGILIGKVALIAANAVDSSSSSIGALVVNSNNVSFQDVSITAGTSVGATGDDGTLTEYDFPDLANLDGKSADANNAGGETSIDCPDGTTTVGGAGGLSKVDGKTGTPGPPNGGSAAVGAGACSNGNGGANGSSPNAASGATNYGDLSADGWLPSKGSDGTPGGSGQGGGGGGGGTTAGDNGGGGGAGGCGGAAGTGGMGGGASIALAVYESSVTVSGKSSLTANDAGNGGDGVQGQPGQSQPGELGGGKGAQNRNGCSGGIGGAGGNGAAGGGGAGGISVGILYKVTAPRTSPNVDSTTLIKVGKNGLGGASPGYPGDATKSGKAAGDVALATLPL